MRRGDCPFCDAQNVLIDKEHALPVWLRDLILKRKDSPDQLLTLQFGERIPYRTRDANIEVHGPCKERCNGGWMANLEGRLRPILRPLVEADPPVAVPIGPNDCAEIAFWMLKTAMVWDFIAPMTPFFTEAERRSVVAHRIEFPLLMWIGRYTGESGHFMAAHTPMKWRSGRIELDGFAFTLMAGHFVTQLMTYRHQPGVGQVTVQVPGVPPQELMSVWEPRNIAWPPAQSIATPERLLMIAGRFVPISLGTIRTAAEDLLDEGMP